MNKINSKLFDAIIVAAVLSAAFMINMFIKQTFDTDSLIPMIFVLGIFLISLKTNGYLIGIISSVISTFAVNYAFTYPYFAFDLISPECVFRLL